MKIYLAGGLKSNWQEAIKQRVKIHTYFDPSKDTDQRASHRWASQEYEAMKSCNLVFAYYEIDNPSGLGMATEIGWANMLNIPVWFIDEHYRLNTLLCALSQRVYSSFSEAIKDLKVYEP